MSFWPSVTVCSLIRPGNSIGPRSEGEQRYQMDIGRGVKKKMKWTGLQRDRTAKDAYTPMHKHYNGVKTVKNQSAYTPPTMHQSCKVLTV